MKGWKGESIAEIGGRAGVKIGIFKEMLFKKFQLGVGVLGIGSKGEGSENR